MDLHDFRFDLREAFADLRPELLGLDELLAGLGELHLDVLTASLEGLVDGFTDKFVQQEEEEREVGGEKKPGHGAREKGRVVRLVDEEREDHENNKGQNPEEFVLHWETSLPRS